MPVGIRLQFYFPEGERHGRQLTHEWQLRAAQDCGIKGASVFRAIAGFGRHGRTVYGHFFADAQRLPVEVRIVTTRDRAQTLLETPKREQVKLFYARSEVECGWLPED